MVSKDIESKIITALQNKLSTAQLGIPYQILGTWQTSTINNLKNLELISSTALIAISTGILTRETFSSPTASLNVAIVLQVKLERDTTGNALEDFATVIDNMISKWQSQNYQSLFTELDTDNFSVGMIANNGGEPATLDFEKKIITATWNITLQGVLQTI